MSKDPEIPHADQYAFKNSTIWNKLYSFLALRVRYWVYSARLSLWRGKEEEIAADIVQDAIIGTLTYVLQYTLAAWGKEAMPSRPLQRISAAIAYNHYREQMRDDSRFVSRRLRNCAAQGYRTIDEQVSSQEQAEASAFQEWYCECLVDAIMRVPQRPREAFLIHLANHVRFGSQPTELLQTAFAKRAIDLRHYQGALPSAFQELKEHEALLQFACEHITKEQKKQEDYEALYYKCLSESEVFARFAYPEAHEDDEHDPEFAGLVARLQATVPLPVPDLAFRESLRGDLLNILVEYRVVEKTVLPVSQTVEMSRQDIQPQSEDRLLPDLAFVPDADEDLELAVLAACLSARAPLTPIDPVFRDNLRKKLKDIPAMYATSRTVLHGTEKLFERLPEELLNQPRMLTQVFSEGTGEGWYPVPLTRSNIALP